MSFEERVFHFPFLQFVPELCRVMEIISEAPFLFSDYLISEAGRVSYDPLGVHPVWGTPSQAPIGEGQKGTPKISITTLWTSFVNILLTSLHGRGLPVASQSIFGEKLLLPPDPTNVEHQQWVKIGQKIPGGLLWLSTRTRPDLSYSVSSAAQVLNKDIELLKVRLRHLLQYVNTTQSLGLLYPYPRDGEMTNFTVYSDAFPLHLPENSHNPAIPFVSPLVIPDTSFTGGHPLMSSEVQKRGKLVREVRGPKDKTNRRERDALS